MNIDPKVMHDVVEFVDAAGDLVKDLTEKNAELEKQLEATPKAETEPGTEKQAAEETQSVLDKGKLEETVNSLIEAGIAKEGEREEILKQAQEDPNAVLGFLDKIAAWNKKAGTVQPMGKVAGGSDTPDGRRESDVFFETRFGGRMA